MGKKSYKLGSVSEILSKNSTAPLDLDPTLCDAFSNSAFTAKPKPTEANDSPVKNENGTSKKKRLGKAKDVKLSHKDAAAIRVEAKRKFQDSGAVKEESDDSPKKKKKRLDKSNLTTESEPITPIPNIKLAKKLKKKEKAALKIVNESQGLGKKKQKKKEKKVKEEASSDEDDEDREDDRLSKFPEELEQTIQEFEREQELSSEDEEDSEEEEIIVQKEEEEKPTKLKIFELNKPKDKNPEWESRTAFVGNLPTNTKEKALKKLFKPFGEIETIRFRGAVPLKPYELKKVALNSHKLNPDQYNITAYIRFKTKEEAEKAVAEMNGYTLDRHNLVVDIADNKKRDNKKAIFVGNIPLKVEDDQLRKFFSECGQIESVRVIRNATTGLSKGFGYVNFDQADAVELALRKDGEDFEGRPVRVARHAKKEKKGKEQDNAQSPKGKKAPGGKFGGPPGKKGIQDRGDRKSGAFRRIALKKQKSGDNSNFTGDKLAEAGSLKRKSNKPNKEVLRKAKIAAQLTGVSTKQIKKNRQKTAKRRF